MNNLENRIALCPKCDEEREFRFKKLGGNITPIYSCVECGSSITIYSINQHREYKDLERRKQLLTNDKTK